MSVAPKSEEPNLLSLRGKGEAAVQSLVEEAKGKGWKSIHVAGSNHLCRATWYEARMSGLGVTGYTPTEQDLQLLEKMIEHRAKVGSSLVRLSGIDIAHDYNARVLPYLQKEYEDLRRERRKAGIRTTDMDRAYGINLPQGQAKEIDERFDRAKAAFLRAIDTRDRFLSVGKQLISVKLSFEDGVARFIPKSSGAFGDGRTGQSREMIRR